MSHVDPLHCAALSALLTQAMQCSSLKVPMSTISRHVTQLQWEIHRD